MRIILISVIDNLIVKVKKNVKLCQVSKKQTLQMLK